MFLTILPTLIEQLIAVFYNRKGIRKDRLALFFTPVFEEVSHFHHQFTGVLSTASSMLENAPRSGQGRRTAKGASRRAKSPHSYSRRLAQAREHLRKGGEMLNAIYTRLDAYRAAANRKKLKGAEKIFMDAVQSYLSTFNNGNKFHAADGSNFYLVSGFANRPKRDQLIKNLHNVIEEHNALYDQICLHFDHLRLSALA